MSQPAAPTTEEGNATRDEALGKRDVTVEVTAEDHSTWASAQGSEGDPLYDGFLERGRARTFHDTVRIDVVPGDSGAMRVVVNGEEISDGFGDGAVERFGCTPAG